MRCHTHRWWDCQLGKSSWKRTLCYVRALKIFWPFSLQDSSPRDQGVQRLCHATSLFVIVTDMFPPRDHLQSWVMSAEEPPLTVKKHRCEDWDVYVIEQVVGVVWRWNFRAAFCPRNAGDVPSCSPVFLLAPSLPHHCGPTVHPSLICTDTSGFWSSRLHVAFSFVHLLCSDEVPCKAWIWPLCVSSWAPLESPLFPAKLSVTPFTWRPQGLAGPS